MQFLAVYLHIPFCRVRCSYCAFNIYTDKLTLVDHYIEAVAQEIHWLGRGEAVRSLYFGGGTPSLLTPYQLGRLMAALRSHFEILPECEITLEANPGDVNAAIASAWRELGINRLSLGMQSALPTELTLYARDHSLEDTPRAFEVARQIGFDNISLDLIYGAPHQTLADWECSLDFGLGLKPEHFSLYALQLEAGTELTRRVKYGELPAPDDDLTADMYDLAQAKLADFEHYEISSWGKRPSFHNMQYWRNLPYLGLGAGAHGCAEGCRTVNTMRPDRYIERLRGQSAPLTYPRTAATQSLERLTRADEMFETMLLGLRLLNEGVSRQAFVGRFGISLEDIYGAQIARLKHQNLICEENETLYLTRQAYFISNRVFEAFLPEEV